MAEALGCPISNYSLASLRYDLSKFRAKSLVEKLPHPQRYRLPPSGHSACLIIIFFFFFKF